MNNKGFSMVELLGVIVILGILMATAVGGVYIYRQKAEQQGFDTLANSAMNAAKNYVMDHPGTTEVTINDLYEDNYLEKPSDPRNSGSVCTGKVTISVAGVAADENIDEYKYDVKLCCANYSKLYKFPGGTVSDTTCP